MKRKWMALFVSLSFVGLILAACGTEEEYQPAELTDVDRCEVCNMAVPHDHNATQIVLKDGKALKFDDIGCLNKWIAENGTDDIGARFVRDYHSEEWINLEEATFVYDKNFKTPMAYGIYSFVNEEDAQQFIQEQGKGELMTSEDLENHHWERNMEMMKKMKEMMMKKKQEQASQGDDTEQGNGDEADQQENQE